MNRTIQNPFKGLHLVLAAAASLWAACSGGTQVPGSSALDSKVQGSISGSFLVSEISPSAALPGTTVTVKGVGLTSDLQLLVGGVAAAIVGFDGEDAVRFTVPEGQAGMTKVSVSKGGETSSMSFLRMAEDKAAVMASLSELCQGQSFDDVNGQKMEGSKDCAGALGKGSVQADHLADGAVTEGAIAPGAVTAKAIGTNAVGEKALADGSVTTAKLANGAVTTDKIAAGAVTPAQLGITPGSCNPNQVLKWSGSAWECKTDAVFGGSSPNVDDTMIVDVSIDPAKLRLGSGDTTVGSALRWNGSKWLSASVVSNGVLDGAKTDTAPSEKVVADALAVRDAAIAGKAASTHAHAAIEVGTGIVNDAEFNYLDGVTSAIQTQINGKAATAHTHAATAIGSGSVDNTEFDYLDGVTASIQTQFASKAAASHTHGNADIVAGVDAAKISAGSVANTEFDYLDGVTSAIQGQLNGKQSSLGFAPLNKAGDSMAAALGLASLASDPAGLAASDKGKVWYNSTSSEVKYWNGSSAIPLGAAGAGLGNLSGETGNSQTLSVGTSGNAPAWAHAANDHMINIPMASAGGGVTAGLLSNSDYVAFNGKQAALSYTPLNKGGDAFGGNMNGGGFDFAALGNVALGSNKTLALGSYTSDPAGLTAPDAGKVWFNGSTGQLKFWDGGIAKAVGTNVVTTTEIFDGTIANADISGTAGIDATKIGGGGVTTAEFNFLNTLTSNVQTQLDTSATAIAGKQASLGYTPLNKAGDVMGAALGLASLGSDPGGLGGGDRGKIWYNAGSDQVKYWNGSAAVAVGSAGGAASGVNTDITSLNGISNGGTVGTANAKWMFNSGSNQIGTGSGTQIGIGSAGPSTTLEMWGPGTTSGSREYMLKMNDLSPAAQNIGAGIALGGNYTTGSSQTIFADIMGLKENSDASVNGALSFGVSSSGPIVERLRISSNGNVGIGTPSPSARLHVIGNVKVGTNSTLQLGWYTGDPASLSSTDAGKMWFNTNNNKLGYHSGSGYRYALSSDASGVVDTNIDMGASTILKLGEFTSDPSGSGVSEQGKIWFNSTSGNLNFKDASSMKTIVTSGSIVNADIAAGAAISRSKIEVVAGAADQVLVNNASGALSSLAQLPLGAGGTGANLSGGSGYLKKVAAGSTAVTLSTSIPATDIGAGAVDATEFVALDGVTSNIQSQFAADATALSAKMTTSSWDGNSNGKVDVADSAVNATNAGDSGTLQGKTWAEPGSIGTTTAAPEIRATEVRATNLTLVTATTVCDGTNNGTLWKEANGTINQCYNGSKVVVSRPRTFHWVFVTSDVGDADWGGLAGADAFCRQQAALGRFDRSETFVAVMSDESTDAKDRIVFRGPIYLFGGVGAVPTKVHDTTLFGGSLLIPIDRNQYGTTVASSSPWTGTDASGVKVTGKTCSNWSSMSGGLSVILGDVGFANSSWISKWDFVGGCLAANTHRIYCISQ